MSSIAAPLRFSDSIMTVLPAVDAVKALSSVPRGFATRNFNHRRYSAISVTSQLLDPLPETAHLPGGIRAIAARSSCNRTMTSVSVSQ